MGDQTSETTAAIEEMLRLTYEALSKDEALAKVKELAAECAALRADNERLREAGRFMAGVLSALCQETEGHTATCMKKGGCWEDWFHAAGTHGLYRWTAVDPSPDWADSEAAGLGSDIAFGEATWDDEGHPQLSERTASRLAPAPPGTRGGDEPSNEGAADG